MTQPATPTGLNWRNEPLPYLKEKETGFPLLPDTIGGNFSEFEITPAQWTHVCAARFGQPQDEPRNWTGRSHRYDVFTKPDGFYPNTTWRAIRWSHGGGNGWLVVSSTPGSPQSPAAYLIDLIAKETDEARRWDLCYTLCEMADKQRLTGRHEAAREIKTAFLEGRLKKRTKNGFSHVEIQAKITTVSA